MNRTVARLNIAHFKRLLEKETDEAKRQLLLRLLAEQEILLSAAPESPKQNLRA
jgi:hypothetical protein